MCSLVVPSGALAGPKPSKPPVPPAPAPEPPVDPQAEAKDKAKEHFERGLALMKQKQHNAALGEFLTSRELYASRGNTQNAAVCLRELGRYDEALELFEALLREFDNLTREQQLDVTTEMNELRALIGTIEVLIVEPGAEVLVDGRRRGTTPLSASLRAAAGPHVVRVYKQGFSPYEQRVVVKARQNTQLEGTLKALRQSGELKVAATGGEIVDVLVDGVVVGKTPWSGSMSVGAHSVALRAEARRGTAPVAAKVRAHDVTNLTLQVTALDAELRVEPRPINAVVAIDGVEIGRGVWEGRMPAGDHRVEIAAEGFVAAKRSVTIDANEREVVRVELERDPDSALWTEKRPSRVMLDIAAAAALAPLLSGAIGDGCGEGCDAPVGAGALAILRGGYQFGVGISLTIDAGFLWLEHAIERRTGNLTPRGFAPSQGTLNDSLRVLGLLAGASAAYHTAGDFPFVIRVGGGVFFGSMRDGREGTFPSSLSPGTSYGVGPVTEAPSMTYAYVSPELRIGYRATEHVVVSLLAQGVFLFALNPPTWSDENPVLAGPCDGVGVCEGEATFGEQSLAADTVILVAPGIAVELGF